MQMMAKRACERRNNASHCGRGTGPRRRTVSGRHCIVDIVHRSLRCCRLQVDALVVPCCCAKVMALCTLEVGGLTRSNASWASDRIQSFMSIRT